MPILAINGVNLKGNKNTQNLQQNKNVQPLQSIASSEPIYPSSNVLKAQSLFRLPNTNLKTNTISFQGLVLKPNLFKEVAATKNNPNWLKMIAREAELYIKPNETRSEFSRDSDRIMHSGAYNRMSGKTQVFTNPNSDMTSTRIHHVNQVASVAEDIAGYMGLNTELTRAIALGHDMGHTPFGHSGEVSLSEILKTHGFSEPFWHEKNSLKFIDDIETKLDANGKAKNLDLTYAVRDGIISHCGEIDENGLMPRLENIDLRTIKKNNRPQPFTWEGCIVKIADKIAYLGKDLEDALDNKFLNPEKLKELNKLVKDNTGLVFENINNTVLINHFKSDLLANSSPEKGLHFSDSAFKLMSTVKKFNYENIYLPKDKIQAPFHKLTINTIFDSLNDLYDGKNTFANVAKTKEAHPNLAKTFEDWLIKYSDSAPEEKTAKNLNNKTIYSMDNQDDYKLAIVDYISGMTDKFAKKVFEEIIFFG